MIKKIIKLILEYFEGKPIEIKEEPLEKPQTFDREDFWNNKWPKNKITYLARGTILMDIRNLILTKSYVIEPKVNSIIRDCLTDDDKAFAIFKWVRKILIYRIDMKTYNKPERWNNPEETFGLKEGDCEDGALLILSMMRIAGIPAYKCKLCAGWVKESETAPQGGHAYVIYLADDDKWYVLDWCYYPQKCKEAFKMIPQKDLKYYKDIWFTCNDEYTWAQKSTKL